MPKNESPWFESTPDYRRFPVLSGEVKADIAVIGAGIAGVMTAWRLAENDVDVILLEKNHVATGDTGFTTAFITRVPDAMMGDLAARYGKDFLQRVFASTRAGQQYLIRTIETQKISCEFSECESYDCAYAENDPVHEREWQALQGVDPDIRLVTGQEAQALGKINSVRKLGNNS